jgi:LMBR1 domain-containing protein 1
VYAAVVVLLAAAASTFVYIYQSPRERAPTATLVSILTLTALLATVLLLPVDVALVSSTTSSKLGQRKDWATQQKVDEIVYGLTVIYYTLFSLDAVLCLVVIPFTYFWVEEYDEVLAEDETIPRADRQTIASRAWGAFKYTIAFIVLVVVLFLVGFFVPAAKNKEGAHLDLDYFRHLLDENPAERALTFTFGLLTTLGVLLYVLYTAAGLALLPLTFIKSAPAVSAPTLTANTASALEANRERQRQLEGRNTGRQDGLSSKDRRELDALVREERTLQRRLRLAEEASGQKASSLMKAWLKIEAFFRPLKLLVGIVILLVALLVWVSMLLTGIDKAKNSVCGSQCGYVLGQVKELFNPMNWILVQCAKVFPVDYVLFLLLVLLFFSGSVVGVGIVGIRMLWVTLFPIRKGHTSPQSILIATVILTLISLAINYSLAMMLAPQYSHFGPQTFCDHPLERPGAQPNCSTHPNHIKPCNEEPENGAAAKNVCTPSVISTLIDRTTLNFSFFGAVDFWAQFAFLGMPAPLKHLIGSYMLTFRQVYS